MEKGINLREQILKLYKEYYHGGLMKLVVIGGGEVLFHNLLYAYSIQKEVYRVCFSYILFQEIRCSVFTRAIPIFVKPKFFSVYSFFSISCGICIINFFWNET